MKSKILKSSFDVAVKNTIEIKDCWQNGLRALGKYSSKIILGNPLFCNGSLDLDNCVCELYPNANRWDYIICYDNEVYFIEVHSAHTSQVSVVLKKYKWLRDWLNISAPEIRKLISKSKQPFYWIQTNGFAIPKHSPQYRQIKQSGIHPISKLVFP